MVLTDSEEKVKKVITEKMKFEHLYLSDILCSYLNKCVYLPRCTSLQSLNIRVFITTYPSYDELFLSNTCADLNDFCPPLSPPRNGSISSNNRTYNSMVIFSCNVGFELQGSNSTKCLPNRTWREHKTSCSCKLTL